MLLKIKLISLLIFLLSIELHAQQETTIMGSVTDILANPIPFSTIAVIDQPSQGTYTDIQGDFILKLRHFPVLLEISNVGYEKKQILLDSTLSTLNNISVILNQKEIVLNEVVVTDTKMKSKTIGSPKSRKGILSFTTNKPFEQLGLMIKNQENRLYSDPKWLSIHIKIYGGGSSGFGTRPTGDAQLRLRLYKIDSNGKVGEDILTNSLFLSPAKGGWYKVDISDLNLTLPPERFIIAVEWLLNQSVRQWEFKDYSDTNYGLEILGHRLSSEEKKYYSTYRYRSLSTGWKRPDHIAERDLHIPCFRLEFIELDRDAR